MITLAELLREGVGQDIVPAGATHVEVSGLSHDSRKVAHGDLFAALPGANVDGAGFAREAVAKGAVALLARAPIDGVSVPTLVAPDVRPAFARAASAIFGHPSFALDVVGVTGTNGKTTTTYLLDAAMTHAGAKTALIGTLGLRGPGIERPSPHTTPEADEISRFAREVLDAGATHLLMEVSSHALALSRVDGTRFRVAAFTNLTPDHLDFHDSLESYGAAKARLFHELGPGAAVINVDDAFGAKLATTVRAPLWRCSTSPTSDAEVRATRQRMDVHGIEATIATPVGTFEIRSPLIGAHNLENLLVAFACGLALELDPARLCEGLAQASGAPGRLERVADPRGVAVLVDYAHTPDALARALAALRPLTEGRLIVVFGCGGDRDRQKRPSMGEAAGRGADLSILTSDNPRTERPSAILADIEPGLVRAGKSELESGAISAATQGYVVVEDRGAAIALALSIARRGDTVLVAGKGHESYQVIGKDKRPFDDREQARRAIAALGVS